LGAPIGWKIVLAARTTGLFPQVMVFISGKQDGLHECDENLETAAVAEKIYKK
jgi:hypothetical protein